MAVRRMAGLAERKRVLALALLALSVHPPVRLSAQDTSAIDRGVRIGIIYRPGVRPGLVVLPVRQPALDSVRTILNRDLDYSDRFEVITLPGGDSVRVSGATTGTATTPRPSRVPPALNYPLYQALGADFAVEARLIGDTAIVVVHDVMGGAVRRTFRHRLPAAGDPGFRLAVHRLSDQVLQAMLGAPGVAATRLLVVKDGKVYRIDQDGADLTLVSSTDRQAMSPAWAPDGRRFAYMEFSGGHGQ